MADASNIDRTIVGWRAWYTGGRTYDSDTTRWEDLPADGFLAARYYYRTKAHGKYASGSDLYWKDGEIYAHDSVASARIRDELWQLGMVKKGIWVTDQEMADAREAMVAAVEAPNEEERLPRG